MAIARSWFRKAVIISAMAAAGAMMATAAPARADSKWYEGRAGKKPNILFVIMDDIGIDQLSSIGYGGASAPPTPTINSIAAAGLRFRNTWSMPECSNGRMALLTGRYPFRTNVYQAIGERDLANSQASPYDVTVSRMLKQAGYKSGLFGKYHLGGPDNNQAGNGGPGLLGWDYFYGWIGGVPGSIDKTAGGIDPSAPYSCGYVPSTADAAASEGADTGACYVPQANGKVNCDVISGDNAYGDSPGLACLNKGGVLVPNATCQQTLPGTVNFGLQNAHYVSPLVVNRGPRVTEASLADPRSRNYRSSIEVNSAIAWINQQKRGSAPWMATVSFSAGHTPIQTPPGHLLSAATRQKIAGALGDPNGPGTNCADLGVQRLLSDAMIEAMDTELGRLMVSTGIAKRDGSGNVVYDPQKSNTLIVIIGDNGSFGDLVKEPFDATRAKSTPYQTGVWVPLVVAGPLGGPPNRDVPYLTNATDVFGLFGEVAGLNPHKAAAPRQIDSEPLLPYLRDPAQPGIRSFNFTQGGMNIQQNGGNNPPCVLGASNSSTGSCSQSPLDKGICEENGGVWWGPGATDPSATAIVGTTGVSSCWEVNEAIYNSLADKSTYSASKVSQEPQNFYAVRDTSYKLVLNTWLDYDPSNPGTGTLQTQEQLYLVNESSDPATLRIDRDGEEVYELMNGSTVTDNRGTYPGSQEAYDALTAYAAAEFATQPPCPGDGNGDGKVNVKDLVGYSLTTRNWSGSSMFDFNYDAATNSGDRTTILQNLNTTCR